MPISVEDLTRMLNNNPDLSADVEALDTMRGRRKASSGKWTEHDMQVAVIAECDRRAERNPLWGMIFAIPNGGYRTKATAGKLKAEGVRAGVPDLFLSVARLGYHGLYIELKVDDNRSTPGQISWQERLKRQGYLCREVRDKAQEVIDMIAWYLEDDYEYP